MFLRFDTLPETKLYGVNRAMSYRTDSTVLLWQMLMPMLSAHSSAKQVLYAVEVYPADFFLEMQPDRNFVKWAAVEANHFELCPPGLTPLYLPSGRYAVFLHRGPVSDGPATYRYIFRNWLPSSGFEIDPRPHLAIMKDKYKHNHPDSEEEIWIPVRPGISGAL